MPALPGQTIVYTLSYANVGNQNAVNVTIMDTVPANTTFNAGMSDPGWTGCINGDPGGTMCSFSVGALTAGAPSQQIAFAVDVNNPFPAMTTVVVNTAEIIDDGSNGPDPSAPAPVASTRRLTRCVRSAQ
ncbi:MAG TPA: hypothetical protein VGB99_13455 [Acidobacteriota bacterium]